MLTSTLEVNGVNGELLFSAVLVEKLCLAVSAVFGVVTIGKGDVQRILQVQQYVSALNSALLVARNPKSCFHFTTLTKCLTM